MTEPDPGLDKRPLRDFAAPPTVAYQPHLAFVPDGDGFLVHIAPPDGFEEPTPLYLGTVGIAGQDQPVRVMLHERNGTSVLIRLVDLCDGNPERVEIRDGDRVQIMEAISHAGVHTTTEVGSTEDFLFGARIVPVRVEGATVYARTLRRGEVDDGRRVHVVPGGQIAFEDGALVAELDHIDDQSEPTASGYAPLTPVLATWLIIGEGHDDRRTHYLLAAARRLDTANLLRIEIQTRTNNLNVEGLAGPSIRRNHFELVGLVELMVISLGRAVDMVGKATGQLDRGVPIPGEVIAAQEAVKAIRDAYEHINERAAGEVRRTPHPDAVTIFDWRRLVSDDVITYGSHELDLAEQVPALISAMRRFFKEVAADG